MDHFNMDCFFDQKKARLHELKCERELLKKQAQRDAWAARLQPLDDLKKECCSKKCLHDTIPRKLLEFTRKVSPRKILCFERVVMSLLLLSHHRNF